MLLASRDRCVWLHLRRRVGAYKEERIAIGGRAVACVLAAFFDCLIGCMQYVMWTLVGDRGQSYC